MIERQTKRAWFTSKNVFLATAFVVLSILLVVALIDLFALLRTDKCEKIGDIICICGETKYTLIISLEREGESREAVKIEKKYFTGKTPESGEELWVAKKEWEFTEHYYSVSQSH